MPPLPKLIRPCWTTGFLCPEIPQRLSSLLIPTLIHFRTDHCSSRRCVSPIRHARPARDAVAGCRPLFDIPRSGFEAGLQRFLQAVSVEKRSGRKDALKFLNEYLPPLVKAEEPADQPDNSRQVGDSKPLSQFPAEYL